jgi:hypothetical protein
MNNGYDVRILHSGEAMRDQDYSTFGGTNQIIKSFLYLL